MQAPNQGFFAAAYPVAKAMAQGSVYSQTNRMGKNSYDCSSFQNRLLSNLGFKANRGATTVNMDPKSNYMRGLGFEWIPAGQGYQPGDIVWKPGHTEMYTGGRNTIGAHSSKNGVSEYNLQNLNSFHGGWRYVGDRFLGGTGNQGNYQPDQQGALVAQGMADPAVQQAVAQSQPVQPTIVLQMPSEEPRGFQGWSMPVQDYSGLVAQGTNQIMQMAQNAGQGLQLGRRTLV